MPAVYEKVRVTSIDGTVPVPYRSAEGALVRGRYYAMRDGKPLVGGEIVERGIGNLAVLHKAERQGYIKITSPDDVTPDASQAAPVEQPAAVVTPTSKRRSQEQ